MLADRAPVEPLALRSICALAAALLSSSPAVAAEPPTRVAVVVVPAPGMDPARARELRRAILEAFAAEPGVRLHDPLQPSLPGRRREASHTPLLARGRQELEAGRYHAAIADLARAVSVIRADLDRTPKAVLAEAMLDLAAALCGAGRRELALRTLVALLVWRPRPPPLRSDPPAGWDRLVDEARGTLPSLRKGSVFVTTIPSRAEAYVDGRRLGLTPVLAHDLVEGTHYLSLRLEGYERTVMALEVRGQRTMLIGLPPLPGQLPARIAALAPSPGDARLDRAAELRQLLAASRGLFVLLSGEARLQLSALYYDLHSGQRIGRADLSLNGPVRAAELGSLALWRTSGTRRGAPAGRPWYRRWWVWTLAGAVVAASVGIPVALHARSSTSNEAVQLRW